MQRSLVSLNRWRKQTVRIAAPPADKLVVKNLAYPSEKLSTLSVLGLLREVIAFLSMHAGPVLLIGVIGFAGSAISGIPAVTVIFAPLAHIFIMRLATAPTQRALLWRGLAGPLAAAWTHGVVTAVSFVCIALPLCARENELSHANQPNCLWEGARKPLALRSADALLLTPAAPFRQWLPLWCDLLFTEIMQKPNQAYKMKLMSNYWHNGPDAVSGGLSGLEKQVRSQGNDRVNLRLMFVAGILLMLIAEPLFALRGLIGFGTWRILWFSLRHFSTLAVHVWLMRLAIVGMLTLLVFMPVAVVDRFSHLASAWGWYGSTIHTLAASACLTVICAIVTTLEIIYITRLFVTLFKFDPACEFNISATTTSRFSSRWSLWHR